MYLNSLFLFFIGLAVASFANVVVYRLNNSLNPLKGRSICPYCGKRIVWYDNIPLLSFALLRGRCRVCHSPISWYYPIVELAGGVFFVLVFIFSSNLAALIFNLFFTSLLLIVFFSDLEYRTIPDQVLLGLLFLVFLKWIFLFPGREEIFLNSLVALLAGASFLFLYFLSRRQGMGLGDVKLVPVLALFLGWKGFLVCLLSAFLTGALIGVILVLLGRKKLKSQIAFGPFLAFFGWVSLFWGERIWLWYAKMVLP